MDDSTLVTRKDAANRDKQYDLRILVNHQISERNCTSSRSILGSVSFRIPHWTVGRDNADSLSIFGLRDETTMTYTVSKVVRPRVLMLDIRVQYVYWLMTHQVENGFTVIPIICSTN